jgi:alpha-N-arabinofuranosidase
MIDSVVTHDAESGAVSIFIVNRAINAPTRVTVDVATLTGLQLVEAVTLADDNHHWRATVQDSTSVGPAQNTTARLTGGVLTVELPAISWTLVRLQITENGA